MKLVVDIEANSLRNPTKIWCIVCKDIDTGQIHIFRNVTEDRDAKEGFLTLASNADAIIGHNFLGYDHIVLHDLLAFDYPWDRYCDTYIVSKLVDFSRNEGHSIEDYGVEFGKEKIKFKDFSKWSQELEDYCVRDVEICHLIYNKYRNIIDDPVWLPALQLEHRFQLICNDLSINGFAFDSEKATKLLSKVTSELEELDGALLKEFPPKLKLIREIHPKVTKHGTLNRSDFRWARDGDLSIYNGGPFSHCHWVSFNPASHKQVIDVLNNAGWKPEEKTTTFIDILREVNRLKYRKGRDPEVDKRLEECYVKLKTFERYGWKINEKNLATLPSDAPSPARTLAKRILLESRRRTLTEWLNLVSADGRIHGKFYGIGAWTHRMAHREPNTANIPREFYEDGTPKLLGKEMRSLWRAPRNRLLVGVDAEGIQLRIFAHYIDDEEFTDALVRGNKSDKTDPHSLNQRILGDVCKSRQAAKRFIYALILGAGLRKLAEILGCSLQEAQAALNRLLVRYPGLAYIKQEIIPSDAKRGYFIGLDGRKVRLPGDTVSSRAHLAMSGYLQNGEAIVIKRASCNSSDAIRANEELASKWFFVNIVHDELQSEIASNKMALAIKVAEIKAEAIREAGEFYKCKCPMAGSYWNDDTNDYTIGTNWYQTH